MAGIVAIMFGALLAAQAVSGLPTGDDGLSGHVMQKRTTAPPAPPGEHVVEGLDYAANLMLSACHEPSILPNFADFKKRNCTSNGVDISNTYTKLVVALDKVLRLYDVQQQLGSESVETSALKIVVDTVINQTCGWIESLNISFSGSGEVVTCHGAHPDPMAQIKKLHVMVSTYLLVQKAEDSTRDVVGTVNFLNRSLWLQQSGIQSNITALLEDTVYATYLSDRCNTCTM